MRLTVSMTGKTSTQARPMGEITRPGACEISMASQATANPSAKLPASPRNTLARRRKGVRRLCNRKPRTAAVSTSAVWALVVAPASSAAKASPKQNHCHDAGPASPSRPSSMFTALINPTTANQVSGIAAAPSVMTAPEGQVPRSCSKSPPPITARPAAVI